MIEEFLESPPDRHEAHNEFIIVGLDGYRFIEYFREIKEMLFDNRFYGVRAMILVRSHCYES